MKISKEFGVKFLYFSAAIVFTVFVFFMTDKSGICADTGSVWDDDEQRCRDDCLTWNEIHGCIYIDEAYQKLFVACASKTADCDVEKLRRLNIQLCEKYRAAWNLGYGYCDFKFEKKDCFKLPGDWEYPKICYEKD